MPSNNAAAGSSWIFSIVRYSYSQVDKIAPHGALQAVAELSQILQIMDILKVKFQINMDF